MSWLAGTLGLSLLLATAAVSQVIEVRPDGSTTTYVGPVLATPEGVLPIAFPAALSPVSPPPADIRAAIRSAASRHGLSEQLVAAVAAQESNFRQDSVSPKGARGIMQLMPQTSRGLGVDAGNLAANVDGGAAYLAQLMRRFDGDVIKVLAAYNAGPEAVTLYGGVPPYAETRAYVDTILGRLASAAALPVRKERP